MSLRQRRGIVDSVTRHGDDPTLRLQSLDHVDLLLGQHFRFDVVEPKLARHGLGGRAAVPGDHDDAHVVMVEYRDCLRRRLLDRVGDAQEPGRLGVNPDEHHGLTLSAKRVGPLD